MYRSLSNQIDRMCEQQIREFEESERERQRLEKLEKEKLEEEKKLAKEEAEKEKTSGTSRYQNLNPFFSS